MAKAISKAKLYIGTGSSPEEFQQIGHLTSVDIPSAEKTEVDMTDMDSEGAESLPGLPDFGELAFSGFYNPTNAGQTAALADANSTEETTRPFRVDLVNVNKRFSFTGYVLRARIQAQLNNVYALEGAVRVSGSVESGAINE